MPPRIGKSHNRDLALLSYAVLTRSKSSEHVIHAIAAAAERLPPDTEPEGFGAFFDRFAEARVVTLGEATHGTAEFYRARAAITRRLIERHGFHIVAVEADWPDSARSDRCVRHRSPEPSRDQAFSRFPTWMWRNTEVLAFIEWLRAHNETVAPVERTEFRGLDAYSLSSSIAAVLAYLDKTGSRGRAHRAAPLRPA